MYSKVTSTDIQHFKSIVGDDYVFLNDEIIKEYSHDETEDLSFLPEVVIKPEKAKEISEILIHCNKNNIPVTPCGARTGLSGGSLPIHGGIALSTERLNRIIEIDTNNLQATVEPGVINQVFKDAVEEKGLFYPPDPASQGSCFLGGNLAGNVLMAGAVASPVLTYLAAKKEEEDFVPPDQMALNPLYYQFSQLFRY